MQFPSGSGPHLGERDLSLPVPVCKAEPTVDSCRLHRGRDRADSEDSRQSRVICGFPAADSSVAAALVHRAFGDLLTCIFVDTGLLRLHERESVSARSRTPGNQARDDRRGGAVSTAVGGVEEPEKSVRRSTHLHRRVSRYAAARSGRMSIFCAGHALSRCHRIVLTARRTFGHHQNHHNVGGLNPE